MYMLGYNYRFSIGLGLLLIQNVMLQLFAGIAKIFVRNV